MGSPRVKAIGGDGAKTDLTSARPRRPSVGNWGSAPSPPEWVLVDGGRHDPPVRAFLATMRRAKVALRRSTNRAKQVAPDPDIPVAMASGICASLAHNGDCRRYADRRRFKVVPA